MSTCHTIRLHAAWKRMVTPEQGGSGETISVTLPDPTLVHCDADRVTYRRCFNRPSGLSAQTVVLLDCGLLPLSKRAKLNEHVLEMPQAGLPDITAMLGPYNELEILIEADHFAEASSASAQLEIRES